jgi:hypothetical protein
MNTKPGYKTTEFWLSALAMILGLVGASGAVPEGGIAAQIIGGTLAILAQLGYTAARAQVKARAPERDVPRLTPPEVR